MDKLLKKFFTYSIALIISSLLVARFAHAEVQAPAVSPSVVGNWKVTFYLEPLRSIGATQCIVMTLVPGTVAGSPTSGTWRSPTFPGWSGQWIQQGDLVRWFGITGGLATSEVGSVLNRNILGGTSFNHFSTSSGAATSSAGTWSAVRTISCNGATPEVNGVDPSSK